MRVRDASHHRGKFRAMPFEIESLANAREVSRDLGKLVLEVSFPDSADEWGSLDVEVRLGTRLSER